MAFSTYELQILHQSKADESRSRSSHFGINLDGAAVALAVLVAIATLVIMVLTYV